MYLNEMQSSITIAEHRLEKMMLAGDVKEVVLVVNKNLVEVSLTPEAMKKEPYLSESKQYSYFLATRTPIYVFRTPSLKIFNENFKAIEQKIVPKKRIGYTP